MSLSELLRDFNAAVAIERLDCLQDRYPVADRLNTDFFT